MPETNPLLHELERAVSGGTAKTRHAALSYATDLLINGRYSDEEIWVFGDIIALLASEIEAGARAQLARHLAECRHAPANVLNKLAADDSIDVAGPVLRQAEQLSTQTLIENAKLKSQAHLLAISQRRSLRQEVTDVLVARGDQSVVRALAKNDGARFSDSGFWQMVQRSENDIILALAVGVRKDIPRHHFQKLIAKASDEVRARLAAINPEMAADIQDIVTGVTGEIHARLGPASRSYFAAKRTVGALHRAGELTERALSEFAVAKKLEEVTVALSLLCQLPVDVTERALLDDFGEMIVVLAKAANLSWSTTRLLLPLGREGGISAHDLDQALKNFSVLRVATAREVIKHYRLRRESAQNSSATLPQVRNL
jgi:uncharacterized protein (DUF2336 family)